MKRRTVADSVANVGESGDRDRCLGTSVAYLLIRAPSYLADAGKARLALIIIMLTPDSRSGRLRLRVAPRMRSSGERTYARRSRLLQRIEIVDKNLRHNTSRNGVETHGNGHSRFITVCFALLYREGQSA